MFLYRLSKDLGTRLPGMVFFSPGIIGGKLRRSSPLYLMYICLPRFPAGYSHIAKQIRLVWPHCHPVRQKSNFMLFLIRAYLPFVGVFLATLPSLFENLVLRCYFF